MSADVTFETLDPTDTSDKGSARVDGWISAINRAFHGSAPNDEFRSRWLRSNSQATLRGAWLPATMPYAAHAPVATFSHYPGTLNTGAGLLPVQMITDVTVAPTHRRQGLMRHLMTEGLEAAVAADLPVSILTASEGSIYGRFGFGPATREATTEVHTSARFRLRERPRDGGRVTYVDPGPVVDELIGVHWAAHKQQRGSVSWPPSYRDFATGFDWEEQSGSRKFHVAARLDAAGTIDGFTAYVVKEADGRPRITVELLAAQSDTAYLDLWEFLASVDLVDRVQAPAPVNSPLPYALVDPRVVRTTALADHLWVRLLDVPRALEARPWFADGEVVVAVTDPMGYAAGTFSVAVAGGAASVTRTDAAPQCEMGIEALSSAYLGDVAIDTLRAAGRITGDEDALRRFAAMADGGPPAWCDTHF